MASGVAGTAAAVVGCGAAVAVGCVVVGVVAAGCAVEVALPEAVGTAVEQSAVDTVVALE